MMKNEWPVSRQEQETDPQIVFKESKHQVSWETTGKEKKSEMNAVSNFKKGLIYSISLFAIIVLVFFHIAFFGSNWISLGIVLTGLPAFIIVAVYLKKRFLGNMSAQQSWILSRAGLTHHFEALGGKKMTHIYAGENIEKISFFPDRIVLKLKRSQRGFSTHVMSPPVSFSPEIRQKLSEAIERSGVKTEI